MPARRAKSTAAKSAAAKSAATKNAAAKSAAARSEEGVEAPPAVEDGAENEVESSREFILRTAQDRRVKFVRLWFTDVLGMLKSTAIVADELEVALDEGITFDGSAIEGYALGFAT